MANEKRLIDADEVLTGIATFKECYEGVGLKPWVVEHIQTALQMVERFVKETPNVDAKLVVQFNALKSLVNGEWVDCKLVQEAMGIDFATGLKLFDFSRTAEWNPAPLNGQKITTKFRLKNAAEVVHGRWVEILVPDGYVQKASRMRKQCSVCGWTNACRYHYCPNCGAKMDGDGNG